MITQTFNTQFELNNPYLGPDPDYTKPISWTCYLEVERYHYNGTGITPEIAFSLAMASMRKETSLRNL